MNQQYTTNPTEADFPMIDRCIKCEKVCDWQPRYEIFARTPEHKDLLSSRRRFDYVPETRVVKICAKCVPEDVEELKQMIRTYYPHYAKRKGI